MIQLYDNKDIREMIRDCIRAEINSLAQTLRIEIEKGVIHVPRYQIKIEISDDTPIESLEWSMRLKTIFRNSGIETFGQLCSMSRDQLLKYRNLGKKSINEINYQMKKYGRPPK